MLISAVVLESFFTSYHLKEAISMANCVNYEIVVDLVVIFHVHYVSDDAAGRANVFHA